MRWIALILYVFGVLALTSSVQTEDPQGIPGIDYPNYFTIPETSFKCSDQKYNPGFYADVETKCQAFHFCFQDRQESFLCPTGTIFNQAVLTCDVWHKSNCSLAQMSYNVNVGPIMERAGKNLPMLLRLRNRSQNEASIRQTPAATIYDKVSSLYETGNETPSDTSNIPENGELKTDTDKSLIASPKDIDKDTEQMILDSKQNSENEFEETNEDEFPNESGVDTNLIYDPNNGYYTEYDQYDEWQTDTINEDFDNYYRDQNNRYGVIDSSESQTHYLDDESIDYSEDSNYPEFTRRSSVGGQLRVRRKPLYVVLDDQPQSETEKANEMVNDGESESTVTESEMSEGKETNLTSENSASESTPGPELFPSTSISSHHIELSTETAQDSEEFENAILSDQAYPNYPLHNLDIAEHVSSYSQDGMNSFDSQETTAEVSDAQDDAIYIENDLEPEDYVPYFPQYENVVVIPEPGEELRDSYSESLDETESDVIDTEDTFVVIPDEYDNVDSALSDDSEMPDYSEFDPYRQQMLADSSPVAGYGTYDPYSSSMNYPQNEQSVYPEAFADIYGNVMPNNERYGYERNYELANELSPNYESSSYENAYTSTELYPYEKSFTERPLELPVTDADLDDFEIEDFNEVENLEEDMDGRGQKLDKPEDVYYVFDFDEQSSESNETKESEKHGNAVLEESSPEELEDIVEQNGETTQSNSSKESTSMNNEPLESEKFSKSNTEENVWSSNSQTAQNEPIMSSDNVKSEMNINPTNTFVDSNLGYDSQPTPLVSENFASLKPTFSSNMGNLDFSTDPRFLTNMGYSESMDFGPYGFGSNMGQFSMMESVQHTQAANPFTQRMGQTEQPKLSPLSAIQEKMRSMKQGKFGAFKKYMSSTMK